MRSQINIVLITPGFAADKDDTSSIPALQHYSNFLNANFPYLKVWIVAIQYPFITGFYMWNGIQVYSAGGKGGKLNRPWTWIKVLTCLFRLHKKNRIDLIHSFWLTEATLLGLIFGFITGKKLVATAMGSDVKPENKYLKILLQFSFRLVMISQFQKSYNKSLNDRDFIDIIPFGILINPPFNIHLIRTIDIIGVGSLIPIKNFTDFIGIIESLTKRFPGLKSKIIGEGIQRSMLEDLIREKSLNENINLIGQVGYEMVQEEMLNTKILLHTSTFEGQALVLTEALAAGLYVVCYPVGIAGSLYSKKIFTGNTKEELTKILFILLQNTVLDHNQEIHFTIDDTCKEYYRIYRELTKSD